MKKSIVSFILALSMIMALAVPAFASDSVPADLPDLHDPRVQSHTIEFTLEPGEDADEDGIMPLIWDQQNKTVSPGTAGNSSTFFIYDRYFAFEVSAVGTNGQAVDGKIATELMLSGAAKVGVSGKANGTVYKYDWIEMTTGLPYYFKFYNYTSSTLKFSVTYYSWP